MLTQRRFSLAVVSAIAGLTSALSMPSLALQTEVIATTFAGDDARVRVLLDDAGGDITVTLTVLDGIADLRGFFLDIGDFSLFGGLEVRGDDVTGFKLDDDDVINLKHGVNLNGGGSPCPCDLGIAIGTPGIGKDDIQETTFVIDADVDLVLDNFAGELLGVRLTSVGDLGSDHDWDSDSDSDSDSKRGHWARNDDQRPDWRDRKDAWKKFKDDFKDIKGDSREGSAKLIGQISDPIIPVPEPTTAWLVALGLTALGYTNRRR
jgi:hypothetical protein